MTKARDNRLKAARARLAAAEAFVKAVKLQATGNLDEAVDAMRVAVRETKESQKFQYPWNEWQQRELAKRLPSLGDEFCGLPPDEARDRVQQVVATYKTMVAEIESRSVTGKESAKERENEIFNRRVEEALAEAHLPEKRGERSKAAVKHLSANHLELWMARAPGHNLSVGQRTKTTWFKDRMTASQQLRAERLAPKAERLAKRRR
jgi:hypothetical protein